MSRDRKIRIGRRVKPEDTPVTGARLEKRGEKSQMKRAGRIEASLIINHSAKSFSEAGAP